MTDRVTIDLQDHVAQVRFNRPDKMNALDAAQFDGICAAGEKLAAMKEARAVVLAGEGRAFCAGLDMGNFQAAAAGAKNEGGVTEGGAGLADRTHGNANKAQHVVHVWRRLHCPVIAAIHGPCLGGGLQIASGADIRVVAPDAKLSIMELRWGLIPDMGSFALWRNFVRDDVLRELVYTARVFTGEEAYEYGFATHLADDPIAKATELAEAIAARNPYAIRAAKALMNRVPDSDEDEILLTESREQDLIMRSPNQVEAVMAELGKRAAEFVD